MSENPTQDPKIRLMVASWPDDAGRGAVSDFCRTHGVSRSWFYKVRARARAQGQWKVLEQASRRPKTSPNRIEPVLAELALQAREDLRAQGWDYGPLSVAAALRAKGITSPSRASLARIFSRAGQVVASPGKRPRSSYRRFVYPAPNCCWQLDATEVPMAHGRTAVVLQLIDDHSRLALASVAAWAETSAAAMQVVQIGTERHGIPQRFLSDNSQAFNPTRRGFNGILVTYLRNLGVEPITGRPGKPTTQGKDERFHRTLLQFLAAQPLPQSIQDLQDLLDVFDEYYNTNRPHQGLVGEDMTPLQAWNATPTAPPPQPPQQLGTPTQHVTRTVSTKGEISISDTRYQISATYAAQTVHVLHNNHTIDIFDNDGTEITTYPRAKPGTNYVGNTKTPEVST